jgi:multiple sugar transport system substrate-binding protein
MKVRTRVPRRAEGASRAKRISTLGRTAGIGCAAAALAGALTAAGAGVASAAPAKITLTWWTWTTNPEKVIANFEKAYPYITVKPPPDYGSGATFYTKLTTALASGTAPCVTQIELDHLPQFLAEHALVPITKYVASLKKDFPTWVWNQVMQNGQVYAVPEDIGPMGLMYQPAVFKKYHLPVPTTWTQFASDAVALHKADPNMYLTYFAPNDGDLQESLWWQAGAQPYHLLSNGTWVIDIDGPIEQKVMTFWGKLVQEGAVAVDQDFEPAWSHHIAEDRYAAMIGAAWSPTYEVDAYLPANSTQVWAVTQIPQWTPGAHADANWGGSTNAITKDCPSNLVKYGALFASYINTSKSGLEIDEKPATPAGGGRGLFPASLARASVPAFNAPIPHFIGDVNEEFSKFASEVNTNFEWSPFDSEVTTFLTDEMGKAAAGKEPWSQVLVNTENEVLSYARSAGFSVEK